MERKEGSSTLTEAFHPLNHPPSFLTLWTGMYLTRKSNTSTGESKNLLGSVRDLGAMATGML